MSGTGESVAVWDRRSEISATVPCTKCDGSGKRPDRPAPGQRWAHDDCFRCSGRGTLDRGHYAYCKRAECIGCRPTMAEIEGMHILDLWAEMLARCVSQTPDTKTREGAIEALRADDDSYSSVAYFAHRHGLLVQAVKDAEASLLGDGTSEEAKRLHHYLAPLWQAADIDSSISQSPTSPGQVGSSGGAA